MTSNRIKKFLYALLAINAVTLTYIGLETIVEGLGMTIVGLFTLCVAIIRFEL